MNTERIKDRIIKKASRIWGYTEVETETSFDPIVSLMLSACASELEKLYSDLDNSHSRIVEKVLDVMFPEEVSGVKPASAVLQIEPTEDNTSLSRYNQFKFIKKNPDLYNPTEIISKEVYFAPAIALKLSRSTIKYAAFDNSLFSVKQGHKSPMQFNGDRLPKGEYWLGIHTENPKELEDLQFYITINNQHQKGLFAHYLQQVSVQVNDQDAVLLPGYNEPYDKLDIEKIATHHYSDLDQIINDTNEFYEKNFFHLKLDTDSPQLKNNISLVEEDKDQLYWVKFKFNEVISNEILQNVNVLLNCFPALNMRFEVTSDRLSNSLNFVQLLSEDQFLDVEEITDDFGVKYHVTSFNNTDSDANTAIIRKGGVARFDQREASVLLQYVLEIIKDETAAFSGIGGDVVKEDLQEINRNINALHQKAKEKNFVKSNSPYLTIYPSNTASENNNCTIKYWSTLDVEANNITSGSELENTSVSFEKVAKTITTTVGGKKYLSTQDKILEYRSALLTRGRIVTIADIKTFGLNHFKNLITSIEVSKGTSKNVSAKEGFNRTINIEIERSPEFVETLAESEWEYMYDSFLLKLEKKSANLFPYNLIVK